MDNEMKLKEIKVMINRKCGINIDKISINSKPAELAALMSVTKSACIVVAPFNANFINSIHSAFCKFYHKKNTIIVVIQFIYTIIEIKNFIIFNFFVF